MGKTKKKQIDMKYAIGDRFILNEIEGFVAFIDRNNHAYLTPEEDIPDQGVYKGLVFAVIDNKGKDCNGNKAVRWNYEGTV